MTVQSSGSSTFVLTRAGIRGFRALSGFSQGCVYFYQTDSMFVDILLNSERFCELQSKVFSQSSRFQEISDQLIKTSNFSMENSSAVRNFYCFYDF